MSAYNQIVGAGNRPWEDPPSPLPTEDHLDSYTGRTAVEWIHHYRDDKPFYLQVLFPGPHDPFDSPAEYRAMYNPADMPPGMMEKPVQPIPPVVRELLELSKMDGMTREQKQMLRVIYNAKITLIDRQIGNLLQALSETGRLEDTWIIYTSDHGEMLGDHRLSHKMVFYEAVSYTHLTLPTN